MRGTVQSPKVSIAGKAGSVGNENTIHTIQIQLISSTVSNPARLCRAV